MSTRACTCWRRLKFAESVIIGGWIVRAYSAGFSPPHPIRETLGVASGANPTVILLECKVETEKWLLGEASGRQSANGGISRRCGPRQ